MSEQQDVDNILEHYHQSTDHSEETEEAYNTMSEEDFASYLIRTGG